MASAGKWPSRTKVRSKGTLWAVDERGVEFYICRGWPELAPWLASRAKTLPRDARYILACVPKQKAGKVLPQDIFPEPRAFDTHMVAGWTKSKRKIVMHIKIYDVVRKAPGPPTVALVWFRVVRSQVS